MTKLLKSKSAIIEVAKKYKLKVIKIKYKKRNAYALFDPLEEEEMKITNKELLDAILKVDKKVDDLDDRLTNLESKVDTNHSIVMNRLDNLVLKNNLVE